MTRNARDVNALFKAEHDRWGWSAIGVRGRRAAVRAWRPTGGGMGPELWQGHRSPLAGRVGVAGRSSELWKARLGR